MKFFRNQRGQGMTEYIIIVALIAIAAIAAFSYFGQTVRSQTGAMSESLAGKDASSDISNAATAAEGATDQGGTGKTLESYTDDNLKPGN